MSQSINNTGLIIERSGILGNGVQRIYRFANRFGASIVNDPILHSYPFAWEAAVVRFVEDEGEAFHLCYDTPLTSDVEVFHSNEETNEFLAKVKAWSETQ